ncbi:hypothetical protein MKX01_017170, partial [Papaver californicum]
YLQQLLSNRIKQNSYIFAVCYYIRGTIGTIGAETTPDGLQRKLLLETLRPSSKHCEIFSTSVPTRISKAKVSDYSEKIEALAAKLATEIPVMPESLEAFDGDRVKEILSETEQGTQVPFPRLRRRFLSHAKVEDRSYEIKETDSATPIKLDAEAHMHIEKHRKLQEDLTNELVGLAQRLKESSLMMSHSVQDTEKVLESTERAVEHSLASTGNANCSPGFTWLLIFGMTCVFIVVVLLIRVT